MKSKPWLMWLGIAAVAILSYAVSYFFCIHHAYGGTFHQPNELEWLRQEYHLTDDQFQRIRVLHEQQLKLCETMCQKVDASNKALENLIRTNPSYTPEVQAALARSGELKSECEQVTLAHIYQVGAVMSPDQGKRFVEEMSRHLLHPSTSHMTTHFQSSAKMHE